MSKVSGYTRGGKRAGKVSGYTRGSPKDATGKPLKVGDRVGFVGGGGGIVSAIGTPSSFSMPSPNAIKVTGKSNRRGSTPGSRRSTGVHSSWASGQSLVRKSSGSAATVNKRLGIPAGAEIAPNRSMQPGAPLPRKPTKRQLSVATKGSRVAGRTTRKRSK